jgi:PEP-CTERM motif
VPKGVRVRLPALAIANVAQSCDDSPAAFHFGDLAQPSNNLPMLKNLIALCIVASACSAANGELRSDDMNAAGDGLITVDTETGLRWLDLTETIGLSVNQFEADPPPGFVVANNQQVRMLFANAGLSVPLGGRFFFNAPEPTARFQSLVGLTRPPVFDPYRYSAGFARETNSPTVVGYFNAAYQVESGWLSYFATFSPDYVSPEAGIWAIQVPEPSTYTLVAVGLLSVSFATWRRKRLHSKYCRLV